MEPDKNYRFIITGGPGSGKTTLINSLYREGIEVFPENARLLINKGFAAPINSKKNQGSFFREILKMRINQHQSAPENEPSFFDRGIVDSLAYFKYMSINPPEALMSAIDTLRYNTHIFVLPPNEDLYHQDEVRKESFEDSRKLYDLLILSYQESGYIVNIIESESLVERTKYILLFLSEKGLLGNKPVS